MDAQVHCIKGTWLQLHQRTVPQRDQTTLREIYRFGMESDNVPARVVEQKKKEKRF